MPLLGLPYACDINHEPFLGGGRSLRSDIKWSKRVHIDIERYVDAEDSLQIVLCDKGLVKGIDYSIFDPSRASVSLALVVRYTRRLFWLVQDSGWHAPVSYVRKLMKPNWLDHSVQSTSVSALKPMLIISSACILADESRYRNAETLWTWFTFLHHCRVEVISYIAQKFWNSGPAYRTSDVEYCANYGYCS